MAEVESRQRRHPSQNSGKPSEQQQQQQRGVEEAEEQSIVKGLLPCIMGIGGVALGIWLFIYILYVPPQNGDGLVQCTRVDSVEELLISVSSEDVTKWKELGEQLNISETLLNHIQNNSVGSKEKTSNVLRAWFEGDGESCWEEVTQALQNIGMHTLAEQLAQDYGQ